MAVALYCLDLAVDVVFSVLRRTRDEAVLKRGPSEGYADAAEAAARGDVGKEWSSRAARQAMVDASAGIASGSPLI